MAENKVTVIGIAGGTGCGKTTVVKRLVEALPPHFVAVVPLDSYYNDTTHMTEEERRAINFDHPDAFDWKLLHQQLADLRAGKPRGLVGAHARAHKAGLMAADDVVGERRAVGIGIHDLAVGHKAELDERLEAVADAEHQAVALLEQRRHLLADGGAAEKGGDEDVLRQRDRLRRGKYGA